MNIIPKNHLSVCENNYTQADRINNYVPLYAFTLTCDNENDESSNGF